MDQPNQETGLELGQPAETTRSGEDADIATIADYLSRRPLLSLGFLFEALERRIIVEVLTQTGGNKRAAAARLGLKYTTFVEKAKRHGIEVDRQVRVIS